MEKEQYFETLHVTSNGQYIEQLQNADSETRVALGLGCEGLAFKAHGVQSEMYYDRAQLAFESSLDNENQSSSYPTLPTIFATTHLRLAPLIKNLVVDKRLSEPDEIRAFYRPFIHDLSQHAARSHKLLFNALPHNESLQEQRAGLVAAFNIMSALGLMLRFQMDKMQTNDWMALPAFIEPESIGPDENNPLSGLWHINVFGGNNVEFQRFYKIYVRSMSISHHDEMTDHNTSVVWLNSDLAIPGDKHKLVSPLTIIDELHKDKGKSFKLDLRTNKLLTVIDNRNFGILFPEDS